MSLNIQKNELHYYIDLLRMDDSARDYEESRECVKALHNVIRTMRYSRHDKICDEDFSRLDFGNIPLNEIYFSINGKNSTSFEHSKMHKANFMSGHSDAINDVAYSPDGKYVLTGSDDHTAIIWDVETGVMVHRLVGHTDRIIAVAFSPDENEKVCMTGSDDCTAILWNAETGEILHKLIGHKKRISTVTFSPDGRNCLTGSDDCTAILWDVERTYRPFFRFEQGSNSYHIRKSIFEKSIYRRNPRRSLSHQQYPFLRLQLQRYNCRRFSKEDSLSV